jgi:hypothetical protein
LKDIYEEYKLENRKESIKYKQFREQLEKNLFLKKFITKDRHGTTILTNYKVKIEEIKTDSKLDVDIFDD